MSTKEMYNMRFKLPAEVHNRARVAMVRERTTWKDLMVRLVTEYAEKAEREYLDLAANTAKDALRGGK